MTCPRCLAEFEPDHLGLANALRPGLCPECGVQLVHSVSGLMKISAVMIASGGEQGFYRSVQDVPEPLRTQLVEITNSSNSGTIVIADRAGKEQITQVMARRENARDRALAANELPVKAARRFLDFAFLGVPGILWAGAALLLAAIGIIAAVFLTHW
jgi:hypothetical protein